MKSGLPIALSIAAALIVEVWLGRRDPRPEPEDTRYRVVVAVNARNGEPARLSLVNSGVGKVLAEYAGQRVIAALWDDGTAVWSADSSFGWPPYFVGQVAPERVAALEREIAAAVGAIDVDRRWQGSDCGSIVTTMFFGAGNERRALGCSIWHFMHDPRVLVVGPDDVFPREHLDDLEEEVRAAKERVTQADLDYLACWDDCVRRARELLPATGAQLPDGAIRFELLALE